MKAFEVNNVCKKFGTKVVLDNITFSLDGGKIYGLIGDNGSGKSVLLKCICGIIPCDSGSIKVNGVSVKPGSAKQPVMGIVIEHPGFLNSLSGWRNLKYLAGIRHIANDNAIKQALECVGLTNSARKQVKKYSLGMRQRLAIAQALMENPSVFIMDEPFNGLDKAAATQMRQQFLALKAQGKTMLLVSHHASDIDMLCDGIFQIEEGNIQQLK